MTKKGHQIFGQKKCIPSPRENPGYAYVLQIVELSDSGWDLRHSWLSTKRCARVAVYVRVSRSWTMRQCSRSCSTWRRILRRWPRQVWCIQPSLTRTHTNTTSGDSTSRQPGLPWNCRTSSRSSNFLHTCYTRSAIVALAVRHNNSPLCKGPSEVQVSR